MKIKDNIAVSNTGFVFDATTGNTFTSNETAKIILKMLSEGKSKEEIKQYFIEKFDVDNNTFENDFEDFLMILKKLNLIEE